MPFCYGGPEGDRTLDLCVANAALSQLSYKPVFITELSISYAFVVVKNFLRCMYIRSIKKDLPRQVFLSDIYSMRYVAYGNESIPYLRTSQRPSAGFEI